MLCIPNIHHWTRMSCLPFPTFTNWQTFPFVPRPAMFFFPCHSDIHWHFRTIQAFTIGHRFPRVVPKHHHLTPVFLLVPSNHHLAHVLRVAIPNIQHFDTRFCCGIAKHHLFTHVSTQSTLRPLLAKIVSLAWTERASDPPDRVNTQVTAMSQV